MINWIEFNKQEPKHEQECLVKMKYGVHQANWNAHTRFFETYLFHNIEFYGSKWAPIEEAE
jgi:hypothetical protein